MVLLNILWMLSLTLALISAAFAITVQQWLRNLPVPRYLPAEAAACLRQRRYDALIFWQVPNIINALPILIQVAVVAFVAGLVILLYPLNIVVASTVVGVGGFFLILFLIATILPIFAPHCPYKSPLVPTARVALQLCFAIAVWTPLVLLDVAYQMVILPIAVLPLLVGMDRARTEWVPRLAQLPAPLLRQVVHGITPKMLRVGFGRFWVDHELAALCSATARPTAVISAVAWAITTAPSEQFTILKEAFSTTEPPKATQSRLGWRDSEKCAVQAMANAIGFRTGTTRHGSWLWFFFPDESSLARLIRRLTQLKPSSLDMVLRKQHVEILTSVLAERRYWDDFWTPENEDHISVLLLLIHAALHVKGMGTANRWLMNRALLSASVALHSRNAASSCSCEPPIPAEANSINSPGSRTSLSQHSASSSAQTPPHHPNATSAIRQPLPAATPRHDDPHDPTSIITDVVIAPLDSSTDHAPPPLSMSNGVLSSPDQSNPHSQPAVSPPAPATRSADSGRSCNLFNWVTCTHRQQGRERESDWVLWKKRLPAVLLCLHFKPGDLCQHGGLHSHNERTSLTSLFAMLQTRLK